MMNTEREREDALTLEILDVIEKQNDVSQRHLARHLGVALGLANSYLKRCARKGLIKISEAPANRYLYYLTPKGFAEKSRLTAQYLSHSLSFYRKAGESCRQVFRVCEQNGWQRLLLCGVSDLAEIATVRANEHASLDIIGFCDTGSERHQFLGRPVWRNSTEADAHDACVLTDLLDPRTSYDQLASLMDRERILVPDVLGLEAPNL
jgi:DNA-binding MarR family transcriptional regulator